MIKIPGIDIKIILTPEFAELSKQSERYGTIIMQTKGIGLVEITAEYHEYIEIFKVMNVEKLLNHGPHDLKINLKTGTKVLSWSHSPVSPDEGEILNNYLADKLPKSFLLPSSFPTGASILFVHKRNRELCLCVDSRDLNEISTKYEYPLRLIEEMLDNL